MRVVGRAARAIALCAVRLALRDVAALRQCMYFASQQCGLALGLLSGSTYMTGSGGSSGYCDLRTVDG